jgi:hypothetical protein
MRFHGVTKRIGVVVIAGYAVSGSALANDSAFGGAGADLVPLTAQKVQMVSEDIVLTSVDEQWSVEARYVFRNRGASEVTVQVGFPEFRCERDSDADCVDVAFGDLQTKVDGTPVQHRQGKLTRKHGWSDFLGVVWLFDVVFPVGREVVVEHRYTLASGGDLGGNRYTSYVTRTGTSWSGPIAHAKFTARLPPFVRWVGAVKVPGLRAKPPRLVLEGTPHVEQQLEGKDWKPQGGVYFHYNTSSEMTLEPIVAGKGAQGERANRLYRSGPCFEDDEKADFQSCLNDLYAAKGYPFKNAALARKYYSGNPTFRLSEEDEGKVWVRDAVALPTFSTSWFDRFDTGRMEGWKEGLARQRAAGGAASGAAVSESELPAPERAAREGGARARLGLAGSGAAAPGVVVKELLAQAEPLQHAPQPTPAQAGTSPPAVAQPAPVPPPAVSPATVPPSAEQKPSAAGCHVALGGAPFDRRARSCAVLGLVWGLYRARRRLASR